MNIADAELAIKKDLITKIMSPKAPIFFALFDLIMDLQRIDLYLNLLKK
jgi:hypothetical protein